MSSPLQIGGGGKTTYFRRLRNLMAYLTAYTFGAKHDVHNQASALDTTRSPTLSQNITNSCPQNGLKLDRSFYPPSVNAVFGFFACFHSRRSPHIRPHTSQLHFSTCKRLIGLTKCRKNLGSSPKTLGLKYRTFDRSAQFGVSNEMWPVPA